jgi:hypothetical protein
VKARTAVLASAFLIPSVAVLVVSILTKRLGSDRPPMCVHKLREIQRLGLIYADRAGTHFYPHSPRGGIASLQVLVDFHEGIRPELFVCRGSREEPAQPGPDGKFTLDDANCSYEMVPWRVSPADPADTILAFDRSTAHHGGEGRNVVHLDGSVEWLVEANFQSRLEKDRQRYGGRNEKGK